MWLVILIPYNLPPWLVIKVSYFMLSLLISGPHQLGNKIDIYLKPMVDELKELWEYGQKLTMPIVKRISRCMQLCCRQYMTIQDLVTCLGKGQRIIILVTFATTNHIQNIWKAKLDSLTIEPIWLWTAKQLVPQCFIRETDEIFRVTGGKDTRVARQNSKYNFRKESK